MSTIRVDNDWTLFLDRDGVINHKIPNDYVKSVDEFEFKDGVLTAMTKLRQYFRRIIVVTNQQGIGKEIMSHEDLYNVHNYMMVMMEDYNAPIDGVYYCPHLAVLDPLCRKPNPGMALEAQKDFPEIRFHKSIMVGDSVSDIEFGHRLKMKTVLVGNTDCDLQDYRVSDLEDLLDIIEV